MRIQNEKDMTGYADPDYNPLKNIKVAKYVPSCEIKKVIYNPPHTIVLWDNDVKTIVKCEPGDKYSKETGLLLCIAKRYFGNTGHYNDVLKEWCWNAEDNDEQQNIKRESLDIMRTISNRCLTSIYEQTLKGEIPPGLDDRIECPQYIKMQWMHLPIKKRKMLLRNLKQEIEKEFHERGMKIPYVH